MLTLTRLTLLQPTAKVKKDIGFDEVTLFSRISAIGWDFYDLPDEKPGMPKGYKTFLYRRDHLHNLYGGNKQQSEPEISKANREVHGLQQDHWHFYNLDMNPNAPQHAGAPGLMISGHAYRIRPFVSNIFIRVAPSKWLYAGIYRVSWSQPLSAEEFTMQSTKVSVCLFMTCPSVSCNYICSILFSFGSSRIFGRVIFVDAQMALLWLARTSELL